MATNVYLLTIRQKDAYIDDREEHDDALLFDADKIFHEYSCTHKLLIHIKTYIKLRSHNGCLSFNECPNSTKIDTVIWINYYLNNQSA